MDIGSEQDWYEPEHEMPAADWAYVFPCLVAGGLIAAVLGAIFGG